MDIQQHSRTHQIKQLAHYLYLALSGFRYLLFLGWPALVVVAFIPEGTLQLGSVAVPFGVGDELLKGAILLLYAAGLLVMIRLTQCFRRLMLQYRVGQLFSEDAINSVRGALRVGIVFVVLSWVHAIAGSLYQYIHTGLLDISFASEILIAVIYFGLMYTLLWALEIGSDLNEESEMTI